MNYHNFILSMLRKEREMQLELDIPPQIPLLRCQYCGAELPQPFFVTKHHGRHTMQYAFCDEQHANEFYLEHLRRSGL